MRRRWLGLFLLAAAALLVVAVLVGNRMGDRVVGQFGQRIELQPTAIPSAEPSLEPQDRQHVFWKKSQVVTAATDPAFPDPRVTPPPTATPRPATPVPTARPATPAPTLQPSPEPTALLTPVPQPSVSGGASAANESPLPNPTETP